VPCAVPAFDPTGAVLIPTHYTRQTNSLAPQRSLEALAECNATERRAALRWTERPILTTVPCDLALHCDAFKLSPTYTPIGRTSLEPQAHIAHHVPGGPFTAPKTDLIPSLLVDSL
jgi:hypothetical protein